MLLFACTDRVAFNIFPWNSKEVTPSLLSFAEKSDISTPNNPPNPAQAGALAFAMKDGGRDKDAPRMGVNG